MNHNNDKSFVVSRIDEFDELDRRHQAMRIKLKRKFFIEVVIAISCALMLAAVYILFLQTT